MDIRNSGECYTQNIPCNIEAGKIRENARSFSRLNYIHYSGDLRALVHNDELMTASIDLSEDAAYIPLSVEWSNYLSGVLQTNGNPDYIAYSYLDPEGKECCMMIYDLDVDADETPEAGEYPYISITSDDAGYQIEHGVTSDVSVPALAYGSFGNLSDIRNGMGVTQTYTILLFMGFFVVYAVMGLFFSRLNLKRKGEQENEEKKVF